MSLQLTLDRTEVDMGTCADVLFAPPLDHAHQILNVFYMHTTGMVNWGDLRAIYIYIYILGLYGDTGKENGNY